MNSQRISTPWGASNNLDRIERGIVNVSTPRHGGFMVAKGYAKKHLSLAAQASGMEWQNYLCYEEDCLADIIFLELPETRKIVLNPLSVTDESLIRSLSYWCKDYLKARGITPIDASIPKHANPYLNQNDNRN